MIIYYRLMAKKGAAMEKLICMFFVLFIAISVCTAADYTDNGDGTITDNDTGLMWMKQSADIDNDNISDAIDFMSWKDALIYCENLEYSGYTDWRLPNINELRTLVDFEKSKPGIDEEYFPKTLDRYWSSTTAKGTPNNAWTLFFKYNGVWDYAEKLELNSVRAVR